MVKNNKESIFEVLFKVSRNWRMILNFWALWGGLLLILILAIALFFKFFEPFLSNARIETNKEGAYIVEFGNKQTIQWLYSASSKPPSKDTSDRAERIWSNSGIEVNKGDRVKFVVSGAVNLAIHHLVESANTDKPPYLHWIGPDGVDEAQKKLFRPVDSIRQKYRIAPAEKQGRLLMQIVPCGCFPKIKPDNEFLYSIGSGGGKTHKIRQSGTMYFTLNEVPLDSSPESKRIYIIDSTEDASYVFSKYSNTTEQDSSKFYENCIVAQELAWDSILYYRYWDLWFDDNVGSFLIIAEVR